MMDSPGQQSIVELVRLNPAKRGLAVIITNDYTSGSQKPLSGTRKDGDRMQRAFNTLIMATYWKQNVSCGTLMKILREVAQLTPSKTYESISFVFAGHGTHTGEVYMQDGGKMQIQDIINSLLPTQAPNIGNIPKLFFFDACRGSNPIKPVMVSRTAGQPVEREVPCRGATDMKTVCVPPNGNVLVAYSTTTNFRSFERDKEGGVWMKTLAEKLTSSKESIEVVLTEVRAYLHATYQDPQWKDYMQMPETINTLLRKVYLHPSVPSHGYDPPPPAPPGIITTHLNVRHPGHYRNRLQHFEQTKVITDLKEDYQGNYICILTFTHASTRRSLRFQSENTFKSKTEAKESAAKVAVVFLDEETLPSQERGNPANMSSGSGGAGIAVDQEKNPISWLKEYCEGKKLPQPQYEEVKCGGQQFKWRVKVEGRAFEGIPCNKKQDAKKEAAQKAVNVLKQK